MKYRVNGLYRKIIKYLNKAMIFLFSTDLIDLKFEDKTMTNINKTLIHFMLYHKFNKKAVNQQLYQKESF